MRVALISFRRGRLDLWAHEGVSNQKGADRGVDGRLYFREGSGRDRQVVISVKSGKLHGNYVRDLAGVIASENADIGVLIGFDKPTQQMRSWAAGQGFYESPWGEHPWLQLLTVAELLEGKRLTTRERRESTERTNKRHEPHGRSPNPKGCSTPTKPNPFCCAFKTDPLPHIGVIRAQRLPTTLSRQL